jgi:hypothetical protein
MLQSRNQAVLFGPEPQHDTALGSGSDNNGHHMHGEKKHYVKEF